MRIKTLLLLALAAFTMPAAAQQSMVTVSKDARLTKAAKLGGKAGVVFMSKSADLVINTTVNKDPVSGSPEKRGAMYEYTMVLDISGGRDRVFTVTKRGTTMSEKTGQVLLRPDEYVYFNVETVSNPITMEQESDGSHYIQSGNGWALIEFNSEIQLDISYSPQLKARLRRGRSKAGAYVDSLIVNIDSYKSVAEKIDTMRRDYDARQKTIDEMIEANAQDQQISTLEKKAKELEADIDAMQRRLNELTYISVKGKDTNERTVDPEALLALSSKSKLRYNIMVLSKTVTVFKTKYEEMVHQAESHKQSRDYAAAKRFYESAAVADGADAANKAAALESAAKMGELDAFKTKTDELAGRLYELSAGGKTVNKAEFTKLIDDIAERYRTLNYETKDAFYLEEANRLVAEKANLGFVFKGRCVITEYKGGELKEVPVTNVRVYGSQNSNCDAMDNPYYSGKGELITTITQPDGRYSINLKPGQYKTIIFEAVGNKDIKKNKHVSVEGRSDDRNVKIRFPKD